MILKRMMRLRPALIDGFAVLVGILLAFGIQAVWEIRQESLGVDAYLESLLLELEENQIRIEQRIETTRIGADRTEAYLVELVVAPEGLVSQDSIRGMIAALGPLRINPISRAAFDDLVGGGLQAIDEGDLRRLILEYGQALERDTQLQRAAATWFESRAQLYDELEGDLVGALGGRGWGGRTDLQFELDPAAFVQNRRYGNLLAARSNHLGNMGGSARRLADRIAELKLRISER
jgi:hypothetical protein